MVHQSSVKSWAFTLAVRRQVVMQSGVRHRVIRVMEIMIRILYLCG